MLEVEVITDAQIEAAWRAYLAFCDRFVIYSPRGAGASNSPEFVVDESDCEFPTVYGPASDTREWHGKQAMRAALSAAAKVKKS